MTKTVYAVIVRNDRLLGNLVGDKFQLPTYTLPNHVDVPTTLSGELNREFGIPYKQTLKKYNSPNRTATTNVDIYLIKAQQPLQRSATGYFWFDTRDNLDNVPFSLDEIAKRVIEDLSKK